MVETEKTVRLFCKFVLDTRAAFHRGEPDAVSPLDIIQEEARATAARITPTISKRSWFGLPHVLPQLTVECNGDPVVAALLHLAIQCASADDALNRGEDEEDVKRRIDACVRDVAGRMV